MKEKEEDEAVDFECRKETGGKAGVRSCVCAVETWGLALGLCTRDPIWHGDKQSAATFLLAKSWLVGMEGDVGAFKSAQSSRVGGRWKRERRTERVWWCVHSDELCAVCLVVYGQSIVCTLCTELMAPFRPLFFGDGGSNSNSDDDDGGGGDCYGDSITSIS